MAKGKIAALKEALFNQHLIMKKLYVELEEEREASATAATEALSMILRLQREKAAEKMEACQYKRMAEERINHAEESLDILEEVIQQKDLEIESLLFQLNANQQKQTNLGINIPDFGDMMLCGYKSCCNNGVFRRNSSLPSLRGDEFCYDKGFIVDESPILSSAISFSENEVDDFFEEVVANKGKSGWKYEAEEVTKAKNSAVGSYSSVASNEIESTSSPIGSLASWFSSPSSDASTDSTKRGKGMKSDIEAISISSSQYEDNENASSLEKQFGGKVKYSALFHDIFEVPESHKGCKSGERCKKLFQDTILETNSMIETPNVIPKEAADHLFRDDDDLKKGTCVDYQWTLMDPGDRNCSSCSDIEEFGRRLQKLEDEKVILQEDSERGKEQLKEMFKQLNTLATHVKTSTSRKSTPMDESSLVSIMEAVLSFSI